MKKENFLKALQTIALGNSQGFVSDDELIKACENYKVAVGHDDDYGYFVKVAKSLQDSINGVEQDKEIAKAIVPGQTKVIDGIMYVYTATPNAKTDYDWRVAPQFSLTAILRLLRIKPFVVCRENFVISSRESHL